MNRPNLTPKEIAQKRLAKSKWMKTDHTECNLSSNKENIYVQLPPIRQSFYMPTEKNENDVLFVNPFNIPNIQRVFTKRKTTRKSKPVPFIMSEPFTICDIDKTFYKVIEGRPLRQFDDIKVYMRNIRDITLLRANAAYLKDQIIQIDTTFAFEISEYKAINTFFIKAKASFIQFAKESYANAKAIQQKATNKATQLDLITEELEALSFEYVAVRNKLGVVNITFETLSKYRQFLNAISPIKWREEHDTEYVAGKKEVTFQKPSIDELEESGYALDRFLVYKDIKPKLFFTKPRQMTELFNNLSRQCLTYMQIDVFASTLVKSVLKSRDFLKYKAMMEINELEEYVDMYKEYVRFMEVKEQEFKTKFEKILLNEFQELYASYDVSKLFTCLQYTNIQVFHGPEDPKDSISTLILQLETEYFKLMSGLDDLNQEVVKAAKNEFFAQDLKMMRMAHIAQRNLKECDILSKALYSSFEGPRRKK